MTPTVHPDFSGWIVNRGDPKQQMRIDPPRPAVVTTQVYDGRTLTLDVIAVARAPGFVCVEQQLPGRSWFAWVSADDVRPA